MPIQAGALGLPVITTDINGCNEIIEDKRNGLLIPVKDTDALYSAMYKIKNDEELKEHLASNARYMIESRYDKHKIWDELFAEYNKLLIHHAHKS